MNERCLCPLSYVIKRSLAVLVDTCMIKTSLNTRSKYSYRESFVVDWVQKEIRQLTTFIYKTLFASDTIYPIVKPFS